MAYLGKKIAVDIRVGLIEVFAEFDEVICVRKELVSSMAVYNLSDLTSPRELDAKPVPKKQYFALKNGYAITALKRCPFAYTVFVGGKSCLAPFKYIISHTALQRSGVVLADWDLDAGVISDDFAVCPRTGRVAVPDTLKRVITVYDKNGKKMKCVGLPTSLDYYPAAGPFLVEFGHETEFVVMTPTSEARGRLRGKIISVVCPTTQNYGDVQSQVVEQRRYCGETVKLVAKPLAFLVVDDLGKEEKTDNNKKAMYHYAVRFNDDRYTQRRQILLASEYRLTGSFVRCDPRTGFIIATSAGGRLIFFNIAK